MYSNVSIESRAERKVKYIVTEGAKNLGVSPNIDPNATPVWYEPDKFKRAQELWAVYKVIIRATHLYGLNLVLYHETGVVPLIVTGNSSSIPKLFNRYLSTALHVLNWFEKGSPFDSSSGCYSSLATVRGMHGQVMSKMNAEKKIDKPHSGYIWLNQYSMTIAQFSFFGLMAIFPKELGYHNFKREDMDAMFHFWRVIGYCLGMEDRFNLCDGSVEEVQATCRYIYFNKWLPVIKQNYPIGIKMGRDISTAISEVDDKINYNVAMRYAAPFLQLKIDDYPLSGLREAFLYYFVLVFFGFLSRWALACRLLGRLSDRKFGRAAKDRVKVYQKLKEKHPEVRIPNDKCPYDITFGYKV